MAAPVPVVVHALGRRGVQRFAEFFTGQLATPHTRRHRRRGGRDLSIPQFYGTPRLAALIRHGRNLWIVWK